MRIDEPSLLLRHPPHRAQWHADRDGLAIFDFHFGCHKKMQRIINEHRSAGAFVQDRGGDAGFPRSREAVNILAEGIADTCICGITFWAWGFAFMFEPGTPFIGTTGFLLQGLPATYGSTGVPLLAFWAC